MRVKSSPLEEAERILGKGGEAELTFVMVPMDTYGLLSERARKDGCTVGEVFQRAILQYLKPAPIQKPEDFSRPKPAIMVKRKNTGERK